MPTAVQNVLLARTFGDPDRTIDRSPVRAASRHAWPLWKGWGE
jgi:hypothetical protein